MAPDETRAHEATPGGTAVAALNMIVEWGIPRQSIRYELYTVKNLTALVVTQIKLLCVLASQAGLAHVQQEFPGLEVGSIFRRANVILTLWC